ncbi:Eukaryotic aspartyl protease family protein [Rhynchospora pubera]|uniref:Eukaryotic aspartyl protease family protein n=1 Tax=Rhynchospora pubera TaxID=906938 RepID=A0AAV8EMS8_9POAL|nr:Eukaryotic aspartyl protease family protein [Rhynchospora pubera]
MASPWKVTFFLVSLVVVSLLGVQTADASSFNLSTLIRGIELPAYLSLNAGPDSSSCEGNLETEQKSTEENTADTAMPLKVHLNHRVAREPSSPHKTKKQSLHESTYRDTFRIQTLITRITERKNRDSTSRIASGLNLGRKVGGAQIPAATAPAPVPAPQFNGQLMATLESGVTLGSGEYLMDVFVGTPARHFSLILDTGSDLNWIQCAPCFDCFEQSGPYYDPAQSASYRNVSCSDPRCGLVSAPDPSRTCHGPSQSCPYFYWYGDKSNTTGDLALETFTVNLTAPGDSHSIENLIFGCGHWNRGLFHGAAGLLGLGRGQLSFASQLRSLYGHTFSYCLVDRNSDLNVSSKLIFGEDKDLLKHPELNYTSFVSTGNDKLADTFYYVKVKNIIVGDERLPIPDKTWELSQDGIGGTIIDSGTTLSYFSDPAYAIIREAFVEQIKAYPLIEDFPILSPCYNISGIEKVDLPSFAIEFADGAVWNFPTENYFIRLDPDEIMCLAILGTPQSSLSIIGNYQQQNFHILYDLKEDRLGFAPMRCAEV